MEPTGQCDWRYPVENPTIETEILIVGGGPAGATAAISAAQAGRKVVLLERYGFLDRTGSD
jgi:succinate dehydrogenase/fumarate reductase flavoprotein subunit